MSKSSRPSAMLCLAWAFAQRRWIVRQALAELALLEQRNWRMAPRWLRSRVARPQRQSLAARFGLLHFEALCLLDEQVALRVDLLSELLSVPLPEARSAVDVCAGLGLIKEERLLVGERHAWLWRTQVGALDLGMPWRSFSRPPMAGRLWRLAATARVRISMTEEGTPKRSFWRLRKLLRPVAAKLAAWLADKSGQVVSPKPKSSRLARAGLTWVSTRELTREKDVDVRYVDVVLRGSQEHAILIAPSNDPYKLTELLVGLERRFEYVLIACSQRRRRQIEKVCDQLPRCWVTTIPRPGGD